MQLSRLYVICQQGNHNSIYDWLVCVVIKDTQEIHVIPVILLVYGSPRVLSPGISRDLPGEMLDPESQHTSIVCI